MVEKLRPGSLQGHVTKSLNVSDFVLTEASYDARSRLPPHAHERSYFCFVLHGVYTERYGRREILCKPSTVTFRASDEPHEAFLHDMDGRVFVIEISPAWIERLRQDSLTLKSANEFCGGAAPRLCARLNREFHIADTAAKLAIEGLAIELLAEASRQRSTKIQTPPRWLKQAREMIIEHFPETLQLAQIAAAVGVHPVYLATAFRDKFGVTIGEFVRKLRIEHACDELIKGDLPLAAIALQAGFVDQSHFSKLFKLYIGRTPARYRRQFHHLKTIQNRNELTDKTNDS
jgi:AraC family transcriptional regulator